MLMHQGERHASITVITSQVVGGDGVSSHDRSALHFANGKWQAFVTHPDLGEGKSQMPKIV